MTMAAGPSSQEPEGLLIVKLEEDCAWSHEVPPPEPEPSPEASHLRFRRFRFQDAPGPREALSRLQELCRGWLRPEMRTKEQILELLVLEQFLTILPQEIQSRVQELRPESGEEAVTLVERMQKELGKLRQQVTNQGRGAEVLLEEPLPLETAGESPSFKLEPMETERSPGPRLQELLDPSPQRDSQAVMERGEELLSGQVGGRRGSGIATHPSRMWYRCQGERISEVKVLSCVLKNLKVVV